MLWCLGCGVNGVVGVVKGWIWKEGKEGKVCGCVISYSIRIGEICLYLAVPISLLFLDVDNSMWALAVL